MLVNDGFDFARVNILAAGNNHVLQPIENVDVTIGILIAYVTSAKHAVTKYRVRLLQMVPIAPQFNSRTRASARRQSALCVFMILHPSKKASLTKAINLDQFCSG